MSCPPQKKSLEGGQHIFWPYPHPKKRKFVIANQIPGAKQTRLDPDRFGWDQTVSSRPKLSCQEGAGVRIRAGAEQPGGRRMVRRVPDAQKVVMWSDGCSLIERTLSSQEGTGWSGWWKGRWAIRRMLPAGLSNGYWTVRRSLNFPYWAIQLTYLLKMWFSRTSCLLAVHAPADTRRRVCVCSFGWKI